ncbi:MAG: alpha/beta fold hydrolase [Candidatus Sericytochromatia bacterium]
MSAASPKSPIGFFETLGEQLRIRLQYGPEFIGDLEKIAVGQTPRNGVYSEGPHRLWHYPAQADTALGPVVLVYSLINRPYIFDLRPNRSLIEFLCRQGYDVYLLDWGDPTPEMGQTSLGELITGVMRRCVRKVQRLHGLKAIKLLGYCMGSTFAAMYAAYRPQDVERMALLTPILGNDADGQLQRIASHQELGSGLLDGQLVSGRQLKWFFNAVKPAGVLKKERDFWQNYDSEAFLEHFLPVEKWSNDTPDLPGKAFAEFVELVIRQDALKSGVISLDGHELDFRAITCPVLAVVARHDWIIPASSLETCRQVLVNAAYTPYELNGGHIGLVVGRAAGVLWKDLTQFLGSGD